MCHPSPFLVMYHPSPTRSHILFWLCITHPFPHPSLIIHFPTPPPLHHPSPIRSHVLYWLCITHPFPRFFLRMHDHPPVSTSSLCHAHYPLVECCFTSTETVGLLGTGALDGHLHFHTAPEVCLSYRSSALLLYVHRNRRLNY